MSILTKEATLETLLAATPSCLVPLFTQLVVRSGGKWTMGTGRRDGDLYLDHLTQLDVRGAEALATTKGTLGLRGVEAIDSGTAAALTKHAGCLFLGVTTADASVMEALTHYKGSWIEFSRLKQLSASAARACVGVHKTRFSFPAMTDSGNDVLEILCDVTPLCVPVENMKSVSESIAKRLATRRKAEDLWFFEAKDISADALRHLCKHNGELLIGLKHLDVGAASILAEFNGPLSLCGVEALTDETAAVLSQYRGPSLTMNNLTKVTSNAVKSLCRCAGLNTEAAKGDLKRKIARCRDSGVA